MAGGLSYIGGMATEHSGERPEGLDQVREILFGAFQHELERRLARAEVHLNTKVNDLQQEARRRIEMIEGHLRKETDALSARLEAELADVKNSLRTMAREQHQSGAAVEQRIAKAEESLVRVEHDLRQNILDQTESFLDELQQVRADMSQTLERELASLEFAPEEGPSRGEPRQPDEKHS